MSARRFAEAPLLENPQPSRPAYQYPIINDCTTCNGTGRVRVPQGFFTLERTCPDCRHQPKGE